MFVPVADQPQRFAVLWLADATNFSEGSQRLLKSPSAPLRGSSSGLMLECLF